MSKYLLLVIFCLFITSEALAGDITLDAENGVEYHQKEQKMIARGNAVAAKDDLSIKADTLIGYYNPKIKNKLSRVEGVGNVRLSSPEAQAFGNDITYDVNSDEVVLRGAPANIKTADADIKADGAITYYQSSKKAVATDNIIVTDAKGNKVYADLMTAYFTEGENGKLVLEKIDMEQNLKVVSQDATVTADKGTYYALDGRVDLFDNVVINQGGNILKGSKAQSNLNTGVSKMLSDKKKGRVSGVFKEKKEK